MKYWHLFPETVEAVKEITETFDFLWATAAAIWNLRWHVRGFLEVVPDATDTSLRARFVEGSGVQGPNIRRFCVSQTWEAQQAQLAKILLLDLFALYEGWCSRIVGRLTGVEDSPHVKGLQFPTRPRKKKDGTIKTDAAGTPVLGGVGPSVSELTSLKSSYLEKNILPGLRAAKKYAPLGLIQADKLLTTYRYFKEARNCVVHNNSLASQDAVDTYQAAAALTAADLGIKEVPAMNSTVLGQPVLLNLRGVVGLYDVVIRLLTTLDAELAAAKLAEDVLVAKWVKQHGKGVTFAGPGIRRVRRVATCFKAIKCPVPVSSDDTVDFLKMKRIAH